MSLTFAEKLYPGYAQTMKIKGDVIVDEKTKFQHIRIFDTKACGRVMVLDDIVQITERDECAYSEMLAHLPILANGAMKQVMIVGGGDGAIAEEVLKHKSIEKVVLCDIDGEVVEYCKQHLPMIHNGVFDDPRLDLQIADAFEYLKDPANKGRFDLIISDRPDPVGPAEVLFGDTFYNLVAEALTERGVAVFQTGVPFFQPKELSDTIKQLRGVFTYAGVYLSVVPTYIGGFMGLTWASKGFDLSSASSTEVDNRWADAAIETDYYTPAVHQAAFALPAWIARLVI